MLLREIISDRIFDTAMGAVKWGSILIMFGLGLVILAILVRLYGPK